MPGVPPQAIIGAIILTIVCLVSTILSFAFGDKILTGDENKTNRGVLDASYVLCTICSCLLTIGLIYGAVRTARF